MGYVAVTRQRFEGLLKGAQFRVGAGANSWKLTHEELGRRAPARLPVVSLGTMSGGDDQVTCSLWWVPGLGTLSLYVERATLGPALEQATPWHPEPEAPAVEQLGLFA